MEISITERSNSVTVGELDKVNSKGLLMLFRQTDAQIFSGYSDFDGLNDLANYQELTRLIQSLVTVLKSTSDSVLDVVMSGAGTSGRIAFFVARTFNRLMVEIQQQNRIRFHYLIAGGDRALTVGIEGAEDNIEQSIDNLQPFIPKSSNQYLFYIGITCGFSAPYIAGQLNNLLTLTDQSRVITTLLGFNTIELARKLKIEKWTHSFYEITKILAEKRDNDQTGRYFIVNPIIGPEPLTGSTRMKSGSTTKILLELIFSTTIAKSFNLPLIGKDVSSLNSDATIGILRDIVLVYEITVRETYYNINAISEIIESTSNSLKNSSKLYYLADESLGIVGFIDASETVPTFGAKSTDVNAYLFDSNNKKGWEIMQNRDGDLSKISKEYLISENDFDQLNLDNNDTLVISISSSSPALEYQLKKIQSISTKYSTHKNIYLLIFSSNEIEFNTIRKQLGTGDIKIINIQLSQPKLLDNLSTVYQELSLKLILNSLTTGGFVFYGKVYSNRMIDLSLTNNKLFYRACGIVENIMKVSTEQSRIQMLRSIYSIEEPTVPKDIDELPVYKHIEYANENQIKNIVPCALLLASGKFTSPSTIRSEFIKQPIIRYHLK
ncbi:hypothetical protein DLAC_07976 [Tieghemostelium lacteum]|uniref:SIS domain-containing protein n=1 Tax=Tieghemostelium lacteum TaxID=361077 RepID=A0A151ZAU9_TIELA|nr:hypothetical protein DLAC_07976 [Tieghemostelium lacteum]|eukprot:KYQ91073.1 hypothetical protein DLAC_07976 [Tieghemostelium lacteum]